MDSIDVIHLIHSNALDIIRFDWIRLDSIGLASVGRWIVRARSMILDCVSRAPMRVSRFYNDSRTREATLVRTAYVSIPRTLHHDDDAAAAAGCFS